MYDATGKKEISGISTEHDFFQNAYWTAKNRFLSGEHHISIHEHFTFICNNLSIKIKIEL